MGGTTKQYNTTPQSTQRLRDPVIDYLMGGGGSSFGARGNGVGSSFDRINNQSPNPTQSVDQLGGASSPFFQNMLARFQPAFDQARTMAIASGKEGAGSLTGSGFANILGKNINRSLTDEQGIISQLLSHGIDLESARQTSDANREAQRQQANAANFLQLLLGQSLAGVAPNSIVSKGGIGALLGPILAFGGQLLGQRNSTPSPTTGSGTGFGGVDPYDPQGGY
jgi:hypothetical protein